MRGQVRKMKMTSELKNHAAADKRRPTTTRPRGLIRIAIAGLGNCASALIEASSLY